MDEKVGNRLFGWQRNMPWRHRAFTVSAHSPRLFSYFGAVKSVQNSNFRFIVCAGIFCESLRVNRGASVPPAVSELGHTGDTGSTGICRSALSTVLASVTFCNVLSAFYASKCLTLFIFSTILKGKISACLQLLPLLLPSITLSTALPFGLGLYSSHLMSAAGCPDQ